MRRLPDDYNGFTGAERRAGSIAQAAERRRRKGPWFVRVCTICRVSYDEHGACIIGHLEDYAEPIKAVLPTCCECHERLHRRFWQPNTWIRYVLALRRGYQPPPYKNLLAFRAKNHDRDSRLMPEGFEPHPDKWWEMLSLEPIDYRTGQLLETPAGGPSLVLPKSQLTMF